MNLNNTKSWILYDWANSVFATSVATIFFPILFRQYWAKDLISTKVTLYLGLTNSLISFTLFLLLPLVGYLLDQRIKQHHRLLFLTALTGGAMTSTLFFVPENSTLISLLLYGFSFIFFALGNTQCDAMLLRLYPNNVDQSKIDHASSLGYLFGYLGGGLLLLIQGLVLIFHKQLGFESTLMPAKLAFLTAGLWWIFFSLPLLNIQGLHQKTVFKNNLFPEFKSFFKSLNKKTLFFLAAFFLYIDVVYTTYKMAVDFGLSMGLDQSQLIAILLLVQFIGVPGTYILSKVAEKKGSSTSIYIGLLFFAIVIASSPLIKNIWSFGFMALLIGFSQGGLQALSRSYFATLIDKNKQGIGFGFLNVFGKLSAIFGPLIVGFAAYSFGGNQFSVLVLLPFLVLGTYFFYRSSKEDS